jgi:4-alpha-glucanotransferase
MKTEIQNTDELINELSEQYGIFPEYWDNFKKKHITSIETKKALLRSMKLKIDSAEDIVKEINERKWKVWKNIIEPVYVISVNNQPLTIPVYIPIKEKGEADLTISWSIENENGHKTEFLLTCDAITVVEQQWIDDTRYIKINISDTIQRDIGYYVIDIECKHPENIFPGDNNILQKKSKLIITPDTSYLPPDLQKGRTWGLSINLYSIRSVRNWGIGDLTDLKKIVRWIAALSGSFVGINPLHAIPNTSPFGISPYYPISRLYKNFIYLDVSDIPEVAEFEDNRTVITSENLNKQLDECRKGDLINYEDIASIKEKFLRYAFDIFYKKHYIEDTHRGKDFKSYLEEEGAALESFALFSAIHEYMKRSNGTYNWQEWPDVYHNPASDAIQEFKKTHEKEILFNAYIQWLIDEQLKEIAELCKNLAMNTGLYFDLAIGSFAGGSDAWSYQEVIACNVDVGAPPDDFSPNGQNWGFPPMIPEKLRDTGYDLFIQTIRKNMKHGGALRIDHALGLFRLFWIPNGMSPKNGAYISYPSEDLLRIIALESYRNRTIVIAEDLGTIGENVRETLKRFHMLSYRLFYFERNYPDPSFTPPEKYPDMALCAVTTHDLPTLYGYWAGQDLKAKKQLGIFNDETKWQEQINEREKDKNRILSVLKSQGIISDDYPLEQEMTPELYLAIYHYLALSPCKLVLVYLDDIIGTLNQQNMPGTVDSYPNWQQKTPLTLEEIVLNRRFEALSEMFKKAIVNPATSGMSSPEDKRKSE